MEKKNQIQCQNKNHDFSNVILFCLNKSCNLKRNACQLCLEQIHQNHLLDCYDLKQISYFLQNEVNCLQQLQKMQSPLLSNIGEDLFYQVSQEIENLKIFTSDVDKLKKILEVAANCNHNCCFQILISFAQKKLIEEQKQNQILQVRKLIQECYQQNIQENKQLMVFNKGNLLLQQQKFQQAIEQYKLCVKLRFRSDQLIINLYTALLFSKRTKEAELIQKQHLSVFQNNVQQAIELKIQYYNSKILLVVSAFNKLFTTNTNTIAFQVVRSLQYDLCKEQIEKILLRNPQNLLAIEMKVIVLLHQKKFGLLKEYITELKTIKPEACKIMKSIIVLWDVNFFSEYSDQIVNLLTYQKQLDVFHHLAKPQPNLIQAINDTDPLNPFFYFHKDIINNIQHKLEQGIEIQSLGGIFQIFYYVLQVGGEASLNLVEERLSKVPNSRFGNYLKGVLLLRQNKVEEASPFIRISMYLGNPIDFYCKFYAKYLVFIGDYKEALKVVEKIQDLNQYNNLEVKGKVLALNSQFFEAQQCFEKMLQIDCNCNAFSLYEQTLEKQNKIIEFIIEDLQVKNNKICECTLNAQDSNFRVIKVKCDIQDIQNLFSAQDEMFFLNQNYY